MSRSRELLSLSLLGVLLGTPVVSLADDKPPAQSVPVIAEQVQAQPRADQISALGTLQSTESVTLTAVVTDTVSAVHFEDGERVKAGKVLVEMTSDEERALLREATVTRDEAERQLQRVKSLADKGSASQSELDQQQRVFKTADARLHSLEASLGDRLIKAPFAGVVGLRQISVGALVTPGQAVTTLDDDSVMKLDFSVPSVFLPALRKGLPIEARARAFPGELFSGEVTAVDSRVDPVTRSIKVRAILPNPEFRLRPGLLMTVQLQHNQRDALVVPEEAVFAEGRQSYVYRIDEGSAAQKQPVVLGQRWTGEVEILSGLDAGQKVVIHGLQAVRPGQAVAARMREGRAIADLLRNNDGT